MRIIISHFYSNENKGDAALLSVLLDDIRRAFDNPQITILTLDRIGENETFEGVPVKNAFMYYARDRYTNLLLRGIYDIFLATSTLSWAYVYKVTGKSFPLPKDLREVALLYQEADLIIPVGGGYFGGLRGFVATVHFFFIIHPFLFSYILGKPTIGYAQSVGPFKNKLQKFMGRFALKRLAGIIVRENISFQLLQEWGVAQNALHSVDSGFLFTSNKEVDFRKELGISSGQILVGVTVRKWMKRDRQANYEKTIAEFCDHIIEKYNAFIIFIPQVTLETHDDDDRTISQRVYEFMEYKENARVIGEQYDHRTIKALYGKLDYLIGTRFHSVIFALTSYVPSIAIEYEYKTRGIMIDLGLGKWVLDIQEIRAEQLIKLFDQLVVEREDYESHLKKVLPPYMERARRAIYFVKEIYEKNRPK